MSASIWSYRLSLWLVSQYDLLRGLHILAMVAWMAGLLYLPRIYVYHCSSSVGSEMDNTFQVMERRLLRGIMNPAMAATFLFGTCLIVADAKIRGWNFLLQPWMLSKLAGVVFLCAWHGYLARAREERPNT